MVANAIAPAASRDRGAGAMGWCRRWVLRYSSTISNPAYRVPVPAGADVHRHRCCAAAPVRGENTAEYPENEYQCCRHQVVQVMVCRISYASAEPEDDPEGSVALGQDPDPAKSRPGNH